MDAGYLDNVESDPEWEMSFAAIDSPIKLVRFGATIYILPFKYYWISLRNSNMRSVFWQRSFKHWISKSLISWPIELWEVSITLCDNSPSTTIYSTYYTVTVEVALSPIKLTNFTKVWLSETILLSSGKCQEYHSLTLIEKVLISLSSNSSKLIDWIMGLSCLFTSREILFLEKVCAKPSLDC